jgi:hypothetical protein
VPKEAHSEQKVRLIFIINGQDYPVEADAAVPLASAVQEALVESGNTARPPSEWEVRDIKGVLLPQSRTPKELNLHSGTRLFLSLQVGAGGVGKD